MLLSVAPRRFLFDAICCRMLCAVALVACLVMCCCALLVGSFSLPGAVDVVLFVMCCALVVVVCWLVGVA